MLKNLGTKQDPSVRATGPDGPDAPCPLVVALAFGPPVDVVPHMDIGGQGHTMPPSSEDGGYAVVRELASARKLHLINNKICPATLASSIATWASEATKGEEEAGQAVPGSQHSTCLAAIAWLWLPLLQK